MTQSSQSPPNLQNPHLLLTCLVTGVGHVAALVSAPPAVKLVNAAARGTTPELEAALDGIELTNHLFLSYLIYDLCHMVAAFPTLGGWDMMAHHTVFIICSGVCGTLRVLGFPFAWLIVGELSTIWLGVRWFLIKTGRGAERSMELSNVAFAATFFATRIVAYAAGLLELAAQVFLEGEGGESPLDALVQCGGSIQVSHPHLILIILTSSSPHPHNPHLILT